MSPDYHAAHSKQFFETQNIEITGHKTPFMSDRLKPFSTDELSALLFSLDITATVEPLTPEPEQIRQELIDELKERALPSMRSTKRFLLTANCERRAISMSLTRPLTKGVPSATRAAFTGDLEKSRSRSVSDKSS